MLAESETEAVSAQRDTVHARRHLAACLVILCVMVVLELTLGSSLRSQDEDREANATHWSRIKFRASDRTPGKELILYVSNSHAATGGKVPVHLQRLLDELQPGRYEVLDLATPGIFAPEMLERVLLGMEYQPKLVIMAVAYISFSDRMKLALQSHSARSFFKRGIFEHLPGGFWLRNYDIGLYLDTFLKQQLNIFRYRNQLRDTWEQPVVDYLKEASGSGQILFLEVDEKERWKFPDGYDNNLFDWRLYAGDKRGHMADLAAAVEYVTARGVPLLGINLPVHWDKSAYGHDAADYQAFRQQLAAIFPGSAGFVDCQDAFPADFSTYDALHPTWHGARLHGLDIVLRLHRQGLLDVPGPDAIVDTWAALDTAVSEAYRDNLSGEYDPLDGKQFRRYDVFEPENAGILMRQLAGYRVGSHEEQDHLHRLSLRLRYWQEQPFELPGPVQDDRYAKAFQRAVRIEIERARSRAAWFQKRLVEFQSRRLLAFPLPNIDTAVLSGRKRFDMASNAALSIEEYRMPDRRLAFSIRLTDGREIARGLLATADQPGFMRMDLLGDNSFILLLPDPEPLWLPEWVTSPEPVVRFGI